MQTIHSSRPSLLAIGLAALGLFYAFPKESFAASPEASYFPSELLVKLRTGPSIQLRQSVHAQVGATLLKAFQRSGWDHVRLPQGLRVTDAIAQYKKLPLVLAAEPNYKRPLLQSPDDPRFGEEWALRQIGIFSAWSLQTGSTNVVVAVIDSGVNYTHEDLAANMWRNPGEIPGNGIDDDGNGYVDDIYGIDAANHDSDPRDDLLHGTACAGIIGAAGNNARGIAGVNWNVNIMALKSHASNNNGYDADIIECFEYVMEMKNRGVNIRVTSNSYGGNERGQAIKDAIDATGAMDILNVFAAGNDGSNNDLTPKYPGSFVSPSIMSVAASDNYDNLTSFSNYGRKSVHLAAPGISILTTDYSGPAAYRNNFLGTSAAAPFVAGAAALLSAQAPQACIADLKRVLISTADQTHGLKNKLVSNGRLNLARALMAVTAVDGPPIVTHSAPQGNRIPTSTPIELTFSRTMNRSSVEEGFATLPKTTGRFVWSNLNRTLRYIPAADLDLATDYEVLIHATAQDAAGNTLDGNFDGFSEGLSEDDYHWSFRLGPPGDDFDQPFTLSGPSGQVRASNHNATRERGEPKHAVWGGGASIWFRWRAPTNGSFTFDTDGSQFDTAMAVYKGAQLHALAEVARNEDYGYETFSGVTFQAEAGAEYRIAVDGQTFSDYFRDEPPMGAITLNWFPTPAPIIVDCEPWSAKPGERVFVVGKYFTGLTNVTLNGISIPFTNRLDTRLRFTVTADMLTGQLGVTTRIGTGASTKSFTVETDQSVFSTDSVPPVLAITPLEGQSILLRWPAYSTNYNLFMQDSLATNAAGWKVVPGERSVGSEWISLTNDCSRPVQFFRLMKP